MRAAEPSRLRAGRARRPSAVRGRRATGSWDRMADNPADWAASSSLLALIVFAAARVGGDDGGRSCSGARCARRIGLLGRAGSVWIVWAVVAAGGIRIAIWIEIRFLRKRGAFGQLEHAEQDEQKRNEDIEAGQMRLAEQRDHTEQQQDGRAGEPVNKDIAVHRISLRFSALSSCCSAGALPGCGGGTDSCMRRRTSHAPSAMRSRGQVNSKKRPENQSSWPARNRKPRAISTTAAMGSRLRQ